MAKILFDTFIEEGIIDIITHPKGISDTKTDDKTLLFPYPSNTTCTIKIPDEITGTVNISIFDANGTSILSLKNINEKSCNLNVSNLDKGMYYVSIKTSDKVLTNKLIVF